MHDKQTDGYKEILNVPGNVENINCQVLLDLSKTDASINFIWYFFKNEKTFFIKPLLQNSDLMHSKDIIRRLLTLKPHGRRIKNFKKMIIKIALSFCTD